MTRSNVRRKHIPRRTCVVCRRTFDKRALNRIVKSDAGVRLDPTGKLPGRGAYLCDDPVCWQKASEGQQLARALKTRLSDDEREMLKAAAKQRLSAESNPTLLTRA